MLESNPQRIRGKVFRTEKPSKVAESIEIPLFSLSKDLVPSHNIEALEGSRNANQPSEGEHLGRYRPDVLHHVEFGPLDSSICSTLARAAFWRWREEQSQKFGPEP